MSPLLYQLHTVSMTLCWILYCSVACCWYLIHYKNLCSRYKYCCCTPWGFLQKKTKGYWNGEEKKKKSRKKQFPRRFVKKKRDRNSEEGRRDKFCFVSSVLQKMCPYWLWRDSRKKLLSMGLRSVIVVSQVKDLQIR